jgi:hypothetical protein
MLGIIPTKIANKESLTTKRSLILIGLAAICGGYILFLAITAPQQLAEATTAASNVVCNGCVGTTDIGNGQVRSVDIGDGTVRAVDIANPLFMKRITLNDGAPGWNPDGATTTFDINDDAVNNGDNAIIIVGTEDPGSAVCSVDNIGLGFDLFRVNCNVAPLNGAELHYAIIQIQLTDTIP